MYTRGRIKFSGALVCSASAAAACEERDRPAKRSKRPNQLPPTRSNRTLDEEPFAEDDDMGEHDGADMTGRSKAPRPGTWAERQQREYQAWMDSREKHCQLIQRYKAVDSRSDAGAFKQMLANRLQQRKDKALENHTCVRILGSEIVHNTGAERSVTCHFLGAAVTFAVPTLHCSHCEL